ncbi:AraC family transcriptional regulator [Paenibacillus sp. FA6]|uniref:helix-turn-helix transcriptional regulator n=1 Tax=Paenibacillus sp. FA6 TaxID=3413029 RepID=UPI003F65B84B
MTGIIQEPIIYQHSALRLKVWRFVDNRPVTKQQANWHYHKEIELILVEQGQHEFETQNQLYLLEPGDIVLLGSSQLHRARKISQETLSYIVLHVDLQPYFDPAVMMYYSHFAELKEPFDVMNYIFDNKEAKREIACIITDIHDEIMQQRKGYELAVSMRMQQFMLTLLRYDTRNKLQAHSQMDGDFLQPIVAYIQEHLAERIDMHEVCSIAGMSYAHFSKYFKRKMGISFTDYVNRKRISNAERLLVTENRSIQDIAESVGINNRAHFYELFKRYNNCTPKQYLDKMLSQEDTNPDIRQLHST